jgi:hypothetical protein
METEVERVACFKILPSVTRNCNGVSRNMAHVQSSLLQYEVCYVTLAHVDYLTLRKK